MNKEEYVLDNGIKLLLINTDKFKTVDIIVQFEDELNDKNITVDNLLLKLLSTKTSEHPSRKEFKTYLRKMYDMEVTSFNDVYGETFSFSIGSNALNSKFTYDNENLLEKQFKLLNEVVFSPYFENSKFNNEYFKEIKNEYEHTLIEKNNYKEYLIRKKTNELFGKNNKHLILSGGYLDELKSITNEDISNKCLDLVNMCKRIIVCGDIKDVNLVKQYVEKYLPFNTNRNKHQYFYKEELKPMDNVCFDSTFTQSTILNIYNLNTYIGDELYYPALLFMEIFNYYLFKIVREEHNLCYTIYCSYVSSRGICYLHSNIESKNYEFFLETVNKILNDLKGNLDNKVVNICKDKIITSLRKEADNSAKLILRYLHKDIYNLKDYDYIIDSINNISDEEVNKVAKMLDNKVNIILKEGKNDG